MPSPKRQTSQGYLSGVLAGGARPFQYRGRMRSILPTATTEGGAQVKSIAKVPAATFHYPLTADPNGPLGGPAPGPLAESVTGHPLGAFASPLSGETTGRDAGRGETGRAAGDMASGPIPQGADRPSVLSGRPREARSAAGPTTGDREAHQDVRPIAEAILKVVENDNRGDIQPADGMFLPEPRRPSVVAPRLVPDSSADSGPPPAPAEPTDATESGGKARPTPINRAQLEVPGITGHLSPAHRGALPVAAARGAEASPPALVQGDSDQPASKGRAAPDSGRQAGPRPDLPAANARPELRQIEPRRKQVERNQVGRQAATSAVPQRLESGLAPMPTSDTVQRLRSAAADLVAKTSRQPSSAAASQAGTGPQAQTAEAKAANDRAGAPNRETVIRQVVVAPSPTQHGAPSAFWERSYLGRFRLRGFR